VRILLNESPILQLDAESILCQLKSGRAALRYHRDQKGDDRCFLDDYIVWAKLSESVHVFTILPRFEDAMHLCRMFHSFRNAIQADVIPDDVVIDSAQWDDDLMGNCEEELLAKLSVLHEAIRVHRDIISRPRTADDDRALYAVLPEKVPADFRLPSEAEFLGEACAAQAGCPAFWRSHMNCLRNVHNFHQWGPCGQ